MTQEEIDSLFENRQDGMLISPAPVPNGGSNDGMTQDEIDSLFENREDGMLISPAPNGGTHEEGSHEEIDPDLEAGLQWMLDFHNTFCSGSTEAMIDSSAPSPDEL